jgi:predicted Zn-dependent protease
MDPRQLEQTIQALEASLEKQPDNLETMRALAEAYLRHGDFHRRAVRLYERVSDEIPEDVTIQQALSIGYLVQQSSELALETQGPARVDQAAIERNIAKLRKFHQQYPRSPQLCKALGDLLLFSGQISDSIEMYKGALERGYPDAAELLEVFQRVATHFSFSAQELLFFADLYYTSGEYQRAKKLLRALISKGYRDADALEMLTNVLILELESTPAEAAPNDLRAEIASLYMERGDRDKALEFLKDVDLQKLRSYAFIKKIAKALIDLDDYRQAFDYLSKIPLDNDAKCLINEITLRLEKRGELDTAVYLLQFINDNDILIKEAAQMKEQELEINTQLELADLHLRNKRYGKALKCLVAVLRLGYKEVSEIAERIEDLVGRVDDVSTVDLVFLGKLFVAHKKFHRAVRFLERALIQDPANKDVMDTLRSIYDEILLANPNLAEIRIKSGDLYVLCGKTEEAIAEYREAANSAEVSLRANKKLARAYLRSGELMLALEKYKSCPLETEDLDNLYELLNRLFHDGLLREALDTATMIYEVDSSYRDIETQMTLLSKRMKVDQPTGAVDTKMQELIGDHATGHYRYMEKIGGGGMGVVHKVFDLKHKVPVAMKILREGLSSSGKAIERFFREARIVASLNHRNIVNIYDYNISHIHGQSYISMEFVDGSSLREIIEDKFSEALSIQIEDITEALYYMSQLCDALDTAHKKGIIHRDIKPDNIMITRNGTVKITDFGIVHIEEATFTPTGALIGTPRYMSPEQVHGGRIDARADIYSVGIILYEFLVGSPPFISGDIAYQQVNVIPPRPRDISSIVPEEVDEIIMKCLEKNPSDRYQSALDLKNALDTALKQLGGYQPEASTHGDSPAPLDAELDRPS